MLFTKSEKNFNSQNFKVYLDMKTKIVINGCYGGFSVSDDGMARYAELKGLPFYAEKNDYFTQFWIVPPEERIGLIDDKNFAKASLEERIRSNELYDTYTLSNRDFDRADPILVQVVEELGEKANGFAANLKIVSLEKGTFYRINEYDGFESIETSNDIEWKTA
jgi:hypothetical protein